MLEKISWMNLLYDFYGQLLTERQKDFIELYYGQNLSLGEIAGEFMVTRQAVHDTLKRAEQMLAQYEEKMGLVTKYRLERDKLSAAAALLDEYSASTDDKRIVRARNLLKEVLDAAGN